jgi:hypothetical protein
MEKKTKKQLKKEAKTALNKADREWSIIVRDFFGNKCAICGKTERLNAHHIIPREFKRYRHSITNGIALCPKCHKFGKFSAHKNPIWFAALFKQRHPDEFEACCEAVMELYNEEIKGEAYI